MSVPTGKERLIMALDVPTEDDALRLVDRLAGEVRFFKIGLELAAAGAVRTLLERFAGDLEVFLDLKLPNDIPTTVARAAAVAADSGVRFLTLSGSATERTIEAAVEGRGGRPDPQLLIVPLLSSQDTSDIDGGDVDGYIVERSGWALGAGCDGVIVSGTAIEGVRAAHGDAIPIVSPGIRPSTAGADDHKRAASPASAIGMGSDYLVVGRPIRDADDPAEAARAIAAEMDGAFGDRAARTAPA